MKEKDPGFTIGIPLEESVFAGGKVKISGISISTSDAAHEKYKEDCEKQGIKITNPRKVSSEEAGRIIQETSRSFGISNWNNCGWSPKGPKPNWVAPEDPSKN